MHGIKIVVNEYLTGCKRAVQLDEIMYVSPSMWELLRHANEEELRHLLESIEVINLGRTFSLLTPPPEYGDE